MFVPYGEVEIVPFTKPQWYLEPVFSYSNKTIMGRIEGNMPQGAAIRWKYD